jgi:Ca-activated chloride channel family protein
VLKSSRGIARGVAITLALAMIFLIVRTGHAQMRVDVNLVVLPATVRDHDRLQVSDLQERDFHVFEDHVLQRIRLFRHEDLAVTVGLVVDHSGSMGAKLAEVIAGARTFIRSSNTADQMFVVNFNENVTLGLSDAGQFTNGSDELERAILKTRAEGQTALYDAIVKALATLQAGRRDKKVLVVISDGADNASTNSLAQVLQLAERSSAVIYAVGVFSQDDPDANPKVLNRLAEATGGEAFFPEKLADVVTICERIAHDIRSQYTIGYVSSNAKRDGVYRAIRVAARAPDHGKLFVRTRPGYIAGGQRKDEVVK